MPTRAGTGAHGPRNHLAPMPPQLRVERKLAITAVVSGAATAVWAATADSVSPVVALVAIGAGATAAGGAGATVAGSVAIVVTTLAFVAGIGAWATAPASTLGVVTVALVAVTAALGVAAHRRDVAHELVDATVRDLTHRLNDARAGLHRQRRETSHLRLAYTSAPYGVALIDADGVITDANPKMCELVGLGDDAVVGRRFATFLTGRPEGTAETPPGGVLRASAATNGVTDDELLGGGATERVLLRADGTTVTAIVTPARAAHDGVPMGLVIVEDITDRRRSEDALTHQAVHDSLTGLPNRTLFLDRLRHALERAGRTDALSAVLFIDLDRFKLINDTLGHAAGDAVVVEVGHRLLATCRTSDTVSRFGGDEFVVLAEDIGHPTEAQVLAERIRQALSTPVRAAGNELLMTASIGIALADSPDLDPEELLRHADVAMYRAKERGRARAEQYDEALQERTRDRLEVEQALRRGIEAREFFLVYQPQVSLPNGRLVGVEALLRWNHPERGVLAPGAFLEVAEETGLIADIGMWALRSAASQAVHWGCGRPGATVPRISVNLSAAQLLATGLSRTVASVLDAEGLPPSAIAIEVTETCVMDDVDAAIRSLRQIRHSGVAVGVDDFGTGYSSLSYLKRLPIDFVKVDRAFVSGIGDDSGDTAICDAIIRMAHSLGLVAVAEGIETADQHRRLIDLGCDQAQGYLFARPLEVPDLERWVRHQRIGPVPDAPTAAEA